MQLNLQEQEVVDFFNEGGELARNIYPVEVIAKGLRWGTAKLLPVLARMVQRGILASSTDEDYPKRTWYWLKRENTR